MTVLFFGLPPLARRALLWFVLLPVLLVTMLRDCGADAAGRPLGVVTEWTDTQVTVRTRHGEHLTSRVDGGESRHCTPGTTFPACLEH